MKPLIIYHDHCTDGFGAAFAAWLKFGDEAEYLPMAYGHPSIDSMFGYKRTVYILDFSLPRSQMEHIFKIADHVIWLDHHASVFKDWGFTPDAVREEEDMPELAQRHIVTLDNNKSGALLAWEYFHPGTDVPMLIQRIDDRDRWQFKLEGSKELHAALQLYKPWSFVGWNTEFMDAAGSVDTRADTYERLLSEGAAILRAQDQHVASMAKQARACNIRDWDKLGDSSFHGLACNATLHISELGHVLATQSGTYALIWYVAQDNKVKCSLRSNGDYDVSAIAKAFGGGGHKNAAGFETDFNTLMGWIK